MKLKFVVDINKSNKMWIKADKSRSQYKIDPPQYQKILHDKITEKYELDKDNIIDQNNKDTYNFPNRLNCNNPAPADPYYLNNPNYSRLLDPLVVFLISGLGYFTFL